MKITAVRGWSPWDEDRAFTIGRHHGADREEAIAAEHSCDSPCCDICHALQAGFVAVAADLLSSAIEPLLIAAVDRAHRFNHTADPGDFEREWQQWLKYWSEAEKEGHLWPCDPCGAFNWGSDFCGSCLARRPLWQLTHAAYCGMATLLVSDVDREVVRRQAAFEIRKARREGFGVARRERGAEWEILEPAGSALVPDDCGILMLELVR